MDRLPERGRARDLHPRSETRDLSDLDHQAVFLDRRRQRIAVICAPMAPAAPSAINEWMKTFTWVRMSPLPWGAAASETTTLTALYHTLAKPSRIILPVRSDSTTGNSGAKP